VERPTGSDPFFNILGTFREVAENGTVHTIIHQRFKHLTVLIQRDSLLFRAVISKSFDFRLNANSATGRQQPDHSITLFTKNAAVVHVLQEEATSYGRMSRYLEHLMRGTATNADISSPHHHRHQQQQQPKKKQDVFESLCDVIAGDAEQPEISEELRTELKAERGELVVDDHIRKEV